MPSTTLTLISSMATKALLADLVAAYSAQHPEVSVAVTSVGGVDAARRVVAGEAFDIVALASDALEKLAASGHVAGDSRVDMVHSAVAVAVPAGAAHPDIATEAALKAAVLAAPTLGYSTGPSGVQLAQLFERWGIAQQIAPRIVTPPPGTSVASLVAKGEVALGFQQLSEMTGVAGIDVIGGLPEAVQIVTTFSAARATASTQPDAVQALLAFLASPATAALKQRHGMKAV
ncbi:substrate-binding domain-containing protein [Hydrogenophaga pseudoflava]|uniref:substrate-binding domain-containing protein n=1 Tax=Hydrogenophaga pseudoflava TaxID=47421 RepID=UPI0027E52A6C|nr:substrate-binding domain-containing protein [Hydrogenophaga pseudoflava]MDQ7743072.1 substrate-binding domain-containing protein [Hydrogenophaga pseudoflava]